MLVRSPWVAVLSRRATRLALCAVALALVLPRPARALTDEDDDASASTEQTADASDDTPVMVGGQAQSGTFRALLGGAGVAAGSLAIMSVRAPGAAPAGGPLAGLTPSVIDPAVDVPVTVNPEPSTLALLAGGAAALAGAARARRRRA